MSVNGETFSSVQLDRAALDLLMPLAAVIAPTGHVTHVGATLAQILGVRGAEGRFLELFELRRPRGIETVRDLIALAPCRLRLKVRAADMTMNGLALALADGSVMVNLALSVAGLNELDRFGLGAHDFPPTDMIGDLLYLTEAKNVAMAEAERLTATLLRENAAALKQAVTDPLTGLMNRRGLEQGLDVLLREVEGFALMHMDLDHFKAVNDSFGHAEGDRMLLHVADALKFELRGSDLMARVGGDEFVIALKGLTDRRVLARIADRIIRRIETSGTTPDPTITLSASIGIALCEDPIDTDAATLHRNADQALYAAKAGGRHQATFYSGVTDGPTHNASTAYAQTNRRKAAGTLASVDATDL
jgi:diguanylate cyclase (GGDEF)-like protein